MSRHNGSSTPKNAPKPQVPKPFTGTKVTKK